MYKPDNPGELLGFVPMTVIRTIMPLLSKGLNGLRRIGGTENEKQYRMVVPCGVIATGSTRVAGEITVIRDTRC
jgi:hypothetical protein